MARAVRQGGRFANRSRCWRARRFVLHKGRFGRACRGGSPEPVGTPSSEKPLSESRRYTHLGIEPWQRSSARPYRERQGWSRRPPSPWRGCRRGLGLHIPSFRARRGKEDDRPSQAPSACRTSIRSESAGTYPLAARSRSQAREGHRRPFCRERRPGNFA